MGIVLLLLDQKSWDSSGQILAVTPLIACYLGVHPGRVLMASHRVLLKTAAPKEGLWISENADV